MNNTRTLANFCILGPLLVPLLFVFSMLRILMSPKGSGTEAFGTAMGFAVAVYFLAIGMGVLFLVGLGLHGFLAMKTRLPCRWAWWYCLVICGACMHFVRPEGTVAGAALVVILWVAKPFRIMRKGFEPRPVG